MKMPVLLVPILPLGLWAVCYVLLRTFAMIPVVVLEDTGPNVAMARSLLLSKDSAAHIFFSSASPSFSTSSSPAWCRRSASRFSR